jgi:Uma2 family endonuclease
MTLAVDQPRPPRVKRWTKQEYNELVKRGMFEGLRVYLYRGELIEMSPQYRPHAFAITELTEALSVVFGLRQGYKLRIQLPFDVPGDSMPEPNALVCTEAQNQRVPHPNAAVLVVEVADSSLAADRQKAFEYAAAQVPEYWIVDVAQRRVEVYRNPVADAATPRVFRYPAPTIVEAGGTIEPLAKLGVAISVSQFFTT